MHELEAIQPGCSHTIVGGYDSNSPTVWRILTDFTHVATGGANPKATTSISSSPIQMLTEGGSENYVRN